MTIIGIDPDNRLSGYGVVDVDQRKVIDAGSLSFVELLRVVANLTHMSGGNLRVVIEAGWKNRGYWHIPTRCTPNMAASLGRSVGMNHQTGILLCECVRDMGIEPEEVRPLRKCWKGTDGKITREELSTITGWDKRSNQDVRDAVLLAWTFSGLPMRIKA